MGTETKSAGIVRLMATARGSDCATTTTDPLLPAELSSATDERAIVTEKTIRISILITRSSVSMDAPRDVYNYCGDILCTEAGTGQCGGLENPPSGLAARRIPDGKSSLAAQRRVVDRKAIDELESVTVTWDQFP
jgi:hypothetical protein